jgi:hypothetical protein
MMDGYAPPQSTLIQRRYASTMTCRALSKSMPRRGEAASWIAKEAHVSAQYRKGGLRTQSFSSTAQLPVVVSQALVRQ